MNAVSNVIVSRSAQIGGVVCRADEKTDEQFAKVESRSVLMRPKGRLEVLNIVEGPYVSSAPEASLFSCSIFDEGTGGGKV